MSKSRNKSNQIRYYYLRLDIQPPRLGELYLEQAIHSAMQQTFGITHGLVIDILWMGEAGNEAIIRIPSEEKSRLLGAIATIPSSRTRLSVSKEGVSLKSVLKDEESDLVNAPEGSEDGDGQ